MLTLELDFNSREEKIFNECTDSVVKQDPKRFCKESILGLTPFELWTDQETDKMCSAAANQVVLDCGDDGDCAPCADEVSLMFTRYANYLDSETSKLYTQIT